MNRRDVLLGAAALAACGSNAEAPSAPYPMRKGVNLGNALDAPNEGDWGYRIEAAHLDAIRSAGFDGVRLPVRWETHMGAGPPYAIEPALLARVTQVVDWAIERDLYIQLDVHHDEGLNVDPDGAGPRFLALWRQIATHFTHAPPLLIYELLNEPNGELWTGATLSQLQARALAAIRDIDPDRLIALGGPNWNSIDGLSRWAPPPDPHVAVTVHYYEPHDFTHQDAEWLGADAPHFGRAWGTPGDHRAVESAALNAANWARTRGLALQLGEFGANARVPLAQRALWTRSVRQAFESVGAAWCVWDFAGAFPIWDRNTNRFYPELLHALFDDSHQ